MRSVKAGLDSIRSGKPGRQGFTLVELMIVVGIIGLLAAIAIPNFYRATQATRRSRFVSDLNVATSAFTQYAMEHGNYPPDTTPGIMPNGMADYLKKMPWREATSLGGSWDWDHRQFSCIAGVSVYQPTAEVEQLEEVDSMIDDGDLAAGKFRRRSNGYIAIIE